MLAIVGGTGRLPEMLAAARPEAPRFAAEGVPFGSGRVAAQPFRLERLGALVDDLRAADVDEVVFAGGMRRPRLDLGQLDAFTQGALKRLAPGLDGGDDLLLRGVIGVFEGAGFRVAAAHELLPGLLPPAGVLTVRAPSQADRADAARGFAVLAALGPLDVGQGCVVAAGQVLAIETVGGTDWMLGTLRGEVPGRPAGSSATGVCCKAPKPGQDRRIDVPTIGPGTVAAAAAARLGGIAVEAAGVIVLDRAETVAAADEAGLFLWVRAG
jgi:DUF1009 family protein